MLRELRVSRRRKPTGDVADGSTRLRHAIRSSMAGVAAVVAIAGCSGATEERDPSMVAPAPPARTDQAPTSLTEATGGRRVPAAFAGPEAGWDEPPTSRVTPARPPSNDPASAASPPVVPSVPPAHPDPPSSVDADTSSPEWAESSHDAVAYRDDSGDATGGIPHGAVNQRSFDILRVEWARVSYADDHERGYSTSITVAGTPGDDGSYVTYGVFASDQPGESCQLYNILIPGAAAFANAFCGSIDAGTRRFIGRVDGSRVTSRPTAGGTLIMATFDDPVIPRQLEVAGRTLFDLAAFTALCARDPARPEECRVDEVLDEAVSTESYRV